MMKVRDLGGFIREQRKNARLSLRKLATTAGVSNPYLSQIERGLRRPSAVMLQRIAKALQISSETLFVQAGILDERVETPVTDLPAAIRGDRTITPKQKDALLRVYESFREETEAKRAASAARRAGSLAKPRSTKGAREVRAS